MIFYVLDKAGPETTDDLLCGTDAVMAEGFTTGPALRCPACNRYLTMLRWLPPYRIELETWGAAYCDIAYVGEVMIVSERFFNAYQHSCLNGLGAFEPVEITKVVPRKGRHKQPPPRYFKSDITYSSTTVDQRASDYIWTDESQVCEVCLFDRLKSFERIVIKQETWNGDDIFFPRGGTRLMVSERFKLFCEANGFLGVVFKDADRENYDYFPWEKK